MIIRAAGNICNMEIRTIVFFSSFLQVKTQIMQKSWFWCVLRHETFSMSVTQNKPCKWQRLCISKSFFSPPFVFSDIWPRYCSAHPLFLNKSNVLGLFFRQIKQKTQSYFFYFCSTMENCIWFLTIICPILYKLLLLTFLNFCVVKRTKQVL